ncbi:SAVED domain-containing protein [Mesorhizobium sp. GR13]|uniref:SAVED domain-containing protein n=1 Tax=Mesorhizobium sp. GR13 TaxID=2562308 RepID=UPI0010C0BD92|nr:SAVED domain-containing protein [Mesorhizobium sp. GR13]
MANAVVPRWHGDNYQSRFFWMHAAALRDPQRQDVVEVTFEADGPKAFDDVVVYYDPGRPSMGPHRITVDFHQIKWHADYSGHFGFRDLVNPDFINATTFSILERLAEAKAKPGVPKTAAFSLVTTDTFTNGDPLAELISPADNSLRIEKLFSTKTDNSRMGEVRRCWREHLKLDDDEQLKELLQGFHIKAGHMSLEDMRARVSERFRLVGLLGEERASDFRYDEAARNLVVRKINRLTRDAFDQLCREESWFQSEPVSHRLNVALRSFSRGVTAADLLDAAPDNTLSLVEGFDGRHLKEGVSWEDLKTEATAFLERVPERGKALRLFLDAHSSLAFLAGSILGFKAGVDVEVLQKGRAASLVWHSGDERDGPEPKIEEEVIGSGKDIAVSVDITRDALADVQEHVRANLPTVGRILRVVPDGGSGQQSVNGGAHAACIADAVAKAVSKVRKPGGTVNFFIAAPNAFSFLLGQHAESMGICMPYEFDFGGRVDGLYRPTFKI